MNKDGRRTANKVNEEEQRVDEGRKESERGGNYMYNRWGMMRKIGKQNK